MDNKLGPTSLPPEWLDEANLAMPLPTLAGPGMTGLPETRISMFVPDLVAHPDAPTC